MFQINQYSQSSIHLSLHLAILPRIVNKGDTYDSYLYSEPAIDGNSSKQYAVQELEYLNSLDVNDTTRSVPSKKYTSSCKGDELIKETARNKFEDYTTTSCQLRRKNTYFATLIQLRRFLIQLKPATSTRRTRALTLTRVKVERLSKHLKASEGMSGMKNPFPDKSIRKGDTQWSIATDPGFGLMGRGTIIRYIYTKSWMITPS